MGAVTDAGKWGDASHSNILGRKCPLGHLNFNNFSLVTVNLSYEVQNRSETGFPSVTIWLLRMI